MNTLRFIRNKIDRINLIVGEVTKYFLALILLCLLMETAIQYLFNHTLVIVKDIGVQMLCVVGTFGGSYALLYSNHLKVDVFWGNWSVKKKAVADIITFVAFVFFMIIFIWSSGQIALESWMNHESGMTKLSLPPYIIKSTIPLGGALLLLQGISKFIHDMIAILTGESEDLQELYYS